MTSITPLAVFPAEGTPDWQVLTDDAVWVTNGPKNTVHRLDVNTNMVAAVITVGKRPCSGLAAGFGSVWVPSCGDKIVSRIDIKTNQVVATIAASPAASEGGIAASPEAVLAGDGHEGDSVQDRSSDQHGDGGSRDRARFGWSHVR